LSETETKLRAATQPRYQLEVGIVKLMELRGVETIGELLQRLNALEGGSGSGSPSTQSSAGSVASSTSPSRSAGSSFAAAAVAPAMETPQPRESASPIDRVKDLLDSRQPRLSAALHDANLVTLENGEL